MGEWLAHRGGRCTGCRSVVAVNVWLGPIKAVIGTAWGRAVEGLEQVAGGGDTEEKTEERRVLASRGWCKSAGCPDGDEGIQTVDQERVVCGSLEGSGADRARWELVLVPPSKG